MTFSTFALIVTSVSIAAFAQLMLRKAMLTASPLPPISELIFLTRHLASNGWLWLGLALFSISVVLWLGVLAKVQVSAAYPMASMGYVFVAIIGALWLGETLSPLRILGLLFICLGVFIISRSVA
jgi:drug/metabolite transporter (DMT)-like permease